jgi:hypothetical protein
MAYGQSPRRALRSDTTPSGLRPGDPVQHLFD